MKQIFVVGKKEKHEVEIERAFWTNKVTLRVDGKIRIRKTRPILTLKKETPCKIKVGDEELHEIELKRDKIFVDGKKHSRIGTIHTKWDRRVNLGIFLALLFAIVFFSQYHPSIYESVPYGHTATTVIYYTNFTKDEHSMTLSIPYERFSYYHENSTHSWFGTWENLDLVKKIVEGYITPDEPVIQKIVSTIENQTHSEEELADALLDFVQYKQNSLSIRYYPTNEFKYPIETLVEMGGDCDTHAFLYATLLKAAGFKCLIALTTGDISHAYVGVHLANPPNHNRMKPYHSFNENGVIYYTAETTSWGYMAGDLIPEVENQETLEVLV